MIYVPSHGLTALAVAPASGRVPLRWRKTQISPANSSPVFFDGRVFTLTGATVLVAADSKTGAIDWRLRLIGTFYSSPIAAASRLYLFNDAGLGQIVALGEKQGTIVSTRDFHESILCTPAVSENSLYVRSDRHLWKIAD